MKLHRYLEFIKEASEDTDVYQIPTYEQAVRMCSREGSPFYESKMVVKGFPISVFNYRLAQYSDFITPIIDDPQLKAYEMRGLTFVFNLDGSLFNRYILLEKFFNLNQTPESMYSVVKNYKIKFVNNKEDGSIASFVRLPNGEVCGKSKMGFDNDQANGINRIYRTNPSIKKLVDWSLSNGIGTVFEYVAPTNRIVLRYDTEELILLRLRDNSTGKHLNLRDYLDQIGSVKIAPFRDDFRDLDHLMELIAVEIDREGDVVQAEDEHGKDFFFKVKTPWYNERHGLLTNDIYRDHVIIGYILDDKIDDVLGQIPEDEKEAHERIHKIISVVKKSITDKMSEINKLYDLFVSTGKNRKEFAAKYLRHPNFGYAMALHKKDELENMTEEEIFKNYDTIEEYEKAIENRDVYELAKHWVRDNTKKLSTAREWLKERDPSLFFTDLEENEDDN